MWPIPAIPPPSPTATAWPDLGSYVKSSGEVAGLGETTAQSGDIDLAVDTFHSQFADHLDTSSVDTLPDMQGAGQVGSLREAATLSSTLANLLTQFAAATDRATQMGMMDAILKAWGNTSPLATTFTGAYAPKEIPLGDAGRALTVNLQNVTPGSDAWLAWQDKLNTPDGLEAAWNGRFRLGRAGKAVGRRLCGGAANESNWRKTA